MSTSGDQRNEQAFAAAIEFVERWGRDMDEEATDLARLAYETGYQRGQGGGRLAAVLLWKKDSSLVGSDPVDEQAQFAAREFVAHWEREAGEVLAAGTLMGRVCFAYEMGYLRGHGAGMIAFVDNQRERTVDDAEHE